MLQSQPIYNVAALERCTAYPDVHLRTENPKKAFIRLPIEALPW
jgi:hypothetical protein